jgi:hypothetical protein
MNSDRLIEVLTRLAELARLGGEGEAAASLARTADRARTDPVDAAQAATRMFGGMGSLNDIILYRDGQPLAAENREFDALRTELHELSLAVREAG